jgi:hypothetical protein
MDVSADKDYRREVQLARERRHMSRTGETERLATAKNLIDSEKAKRESTVMLAPLGDSKSAPTSPLTREPRTLPPAANEQQPGDERRRRTTSNQSASSSRTPGSVVPLTRRSLSQHELAAGGSVHQSTSTPPFFAAPPTMVRLPAPTAAIMQPVYVPVPVPAGHPMFSPGYTGVLGHTPSQSTLTLHQAGLARGRRQSGLQMSSVRPIHPAQRTSSSRPRSPIR